MTQDGSSLWGMSLSGARRAAYLTSRTLGDVKAITRGRIGQRVGNRIMGRTVSRLMRKVWF